MDDLSLAAGISSQNIFEAKRPSIGFVDDVFRHAFWPAKEFFYEILNGPLSEASGAPCWPSVRQMMWAEGHLTPPSVPPGPIQDDGEWLSQYNELSAEKRQLLSQYMDPQSIYICYEGSPGLLRYLDECGITYIDFRISPLRFLPDILMAIRSNSERINALLATICLPRKEIEREALLMGASYRHQQRYSGVTPSSSSDKPLLFVGQTATDASIIVGQKYFAMEDAPPAVAAMFRDRDVIYLRHPTTSDQHVRKEMHALAAFGPRSMKPSDVNSYDLLCSDEPYEFFGISSGLLQEAAFFGKASTALLPHICPLGYSDDKADTGGYYQFTFETFSDVALWNAILGKSAFTGRDTVKNLKHNQLRELHDVWWGYAMHRGRPTNYARAQNRDLHFQVARLNRNTSFLLALVSNEPAAGDSVSDPISSRRWSWVSGGIVSFDRDGIIRRDGQRNGVWRRATTQNAVIAIWDEGGWIDLVQYSGNNTLNCRNTLGHTFQVSAAGNDPIESGNFAR